MKSMDNGNYLHQNDKLRAFKVDKQNNKKLFLPHIWDLSSIYWMNDNIYLLIPFNQAVYHKFTSITIDSRIHDFFF